MRDAIYAQMGTRALAGVLAALVVGDQGAIERADWDVFRATGVAHLMSISGLHVTMFAWLAARAGWAWLWRRCAAAVPALAGAARGAWWRLAAGGRLCAVQRLGRAVAAHGLDAGHCGAAAAERRALALAAGLAAGLAVVVALDPWALLQAGFWLQFVAVGVLFATGCRAHGSAARDRGGPRLARWPGGCDRRALREQWVVTLALTPLSLLLFNQVSLVGLLANAVAIPWVTLVVTPLAMLGVLLAAAVGRGGAGRGGAGWCFCSGWPRCRSPPCRRRAPPLWAGAAGVAGGAAAGDAPALARARCWAAPAAARAAVAAAAAGGRRVRAARRRRRAGQCGDRAHGQPHAGVRRRPPLTAAKAMPATACWCRCCAPRRAVDTAGAEPPRQRPHRRRAGRAGDAAAGRAAAVRSRTATRCRPCGRRQRCAAGQRWDWDGVRFRRAAPAAGRLRRREPKPNAMSCVLRICQWRAHAALLAGDIEQAQEERLVAARRSRCGPTCCWCRTTAAKPRPAAAFLDAVQPRWRWRRRVTATASAIPRRACWSVTASAGHRGDRLARCGAASWDIDALSEVRLRARVAPRYWHHRSP